VRTHAQDVPVEKGAHYNDESMTDLVHCDADDDDDDDDDDDEEKEA
jgi:hypothetical protein